MNLNDIVEVELTKEGLGLWNSFGGPEPLDGRKLRIPLRKLMVVFGPLLEALDGDFFVKDEVVCQCDCRSKKG